VREWAKKMGKKLTLGKVKSPSERLKNRGGEGGQWITLDDNP